jgi:hypothetical protein
MAPPEIGSFAVSPDLILNGDSATLGWEVSNADTCNIEPDIGSVDLTGSRTISPSQDATYTLTATGPGGTTTASVSLAVNHPPEIITAAITSGVTGEPYNYNVEAHDADMDPLTFTLLQAPSGLSIDSASGVLTWSEP